MKVLGINSVPYGSTCRIMLGITGVAKERNIDADTASGYSTHPVKELPYDHIHIGGFLNKAIHMELARFSGFNGVFSILPTLKLIKQIDQEKHDLVHLHNVHGWYINLPLLFGYLRRKQIRVIWTLHDCWAFTGQCPYFTMIKCDKWKTGCYKCPQCNSYPETYVDRSKTMYGLKKKWFTGLNATIVTPSQWLADLVSQSFLKEYPVKVINNGIDLSIFKPTASDFRKKYRCEDKYIVLGVAFGWGKRKGLDVLVELAERLSDQYQVVLVGTDDKVDQQLPENIISIHRTQNQQELAEIYAAADVFANPTREENYPTVNMEALACGTPVITFKTGGSPEIIDETCGIVVPCDDVDAMEQEIRNVCEKKLFSQDVCVEKAKAFDMKERFEEYVKLYSTH